MKENTISRDNATFFVVAVGMSLGMGYFAQAVLDSFREISQFPTDNAGYPGYIRIDSSAIRKEKEERWYEFVEKIRGGLLPKVSYGFSSVTDFKGDLAEQVLIKEGGYIFSFHIKQYERDVAHRFEIINPEDLDGIPEKEKLGRVVHLAITPEQLL